MPSMYGRYIRPIKINNKPEKILTNESVQDQIVKRDLYSLLNKNSRSKMLMNTTAKVFEWIAIITLSLLILSIFGNLIFSWWTGKETPSYLGIIFVVMFLGGFVGLIGSGTASNLFVKKEYIELSFLVKYWILNFNKEILFSIQCSAIHKYLKNNSKMDKNYIDYLIAYYTERSDSLHKLRWLPVAIFTAFLFPLWNISLNKLFAASNLSTAIGIILTLILAATIIVWLFRKVIEPIIFYKSIKYLQLATILRTVKTF
ncbi:MULTISPECIES: hypothetical protein [Paenibacillus]|nr:MULTISPECIES: hypothetical protein [Paenibacillus]KGP77410.1 hypothetical protein P364_0133130 [Paenibacillus sp. MAEPY2]KGP79369.1 hypothetical protein P363_0131120 [Paenibacillus sp. MAEPY1]OZQ60185.1 hypothetical protein CA599_30840 [Paenibacillus taichungensis]